MIEACDASTPHYDAFVSITQSLRCPVCEGQRIYNSNAPFALNVQRDVCALLVEGKTDADISNIVDSKYGGGLITEGHTGMAIITALLIIIIIAIILAKYSKLLRR